MLPDCIAHAAQKFSRGLYRIALLTLAHPYLLLKIEGVGYLPETFEGFVSDE